jgi:hypothetical protein
MSTIISVSISAEQLAFCKEMDLSPSDLLQSSINSNMDNARASEKTIREQFRRIGSLQTLLLKANNFIEAKGLTEDFQNV